MEAKEYFKNPRKISEKQMSDLAIWMQELGDLGCVVHDQNSNEIISGNQRSKVVDLNNCNIEIVKEFDPPTVQGTLALGYIEYKGERFGYRLVKWTPEQCEKANIIANKGGGEWNHDVLTSDFDKNLLLEIGFEESELTIDEKHDKKKRDKSGSTSKTELSFKIEFNTLAEKKAFHKFLKHIKSLYPEKKNVSERITEFIKTNS
jgi:hypothetical protein